jgi:hypothetical protein
MRKVFMTQAGNLVHHLNGRADVLTTNCVAVLGGSRELLVARMVSDAPHLAPIERDIYDHTCHRAEGLISVSITIAVPVRSYGGLYAERPMGPSKGSPVEHLGASHRQRKRRNSGY